MKIEVFLVYRCDRCGRKPVNVNGVENCDYCLKDLTKSDLIDYACCGHGNSKLAYISFKDGRRWIIDEDFEESKYILDIDRLQK